jgi:hypothetical protein
MGYSRHNVKINTRGSRPIAVAAALLTAFTFHAADVRADTLLNCKYEKTLHLDKLEMGATSGDFSISVAGFKDKNAVELTEPPYGLCLVDGNETTEIQLIFYCRSQVAGKFIERRFEIGRTSGVFEEMFSFDGKLGLIHYGNCSVTKTLF